MRRLLLTTVAVACWSAPALASPVEFYGDGVRAMGRAGAAVALADGAEGALANPATLPGLDHTELSLGYLNAHTFFRPLPDVWWDTNQDGLVNDSDPPLDVGPSYDPVSGVLISLARPLGDKVAIGGTLFVPTNRLLRLQTFEPQLPTYFLYANRSQRYAFGLGGGWRPAYGLAFGAGLQIIPQAKYSINGTLNVAVSGAESDGEAVSDVVGVGLDVHSMSLDLVPGYAPMFSTHWDVGQAIPALDGVEIGAAWRGEAGLPVDVDINLQANVGSEQIGDLEPVLVPAVLGIDLGVFDHYLPPQWSWGASYSLQDIWTLTTEARWTRWDRWQVSVAEVVDSEIRGATVDLGEDPVADGNPYTLNLRPTLSGRVGTELSLPAIPHAGAFGRMVWTVRGGVGYEPTPLLSQGAESAFLDADRLIYAVGAGVEHEDPFHTGLASKIRWDGFFQHHSLQRTSLDRQWPDGVQAGSPVAGYPVHGESLPIGGKLEAFGVQVGVEY